MKRHLLGSVCSHEKIVEIRSKIGVFSSSLDGSGSQQLGAWTHFWSRRVRHWERVPVSRDGCA